MTRRRSSAAAPRAAKAADSVGAPSGGLALHEAATRAQALLRERDRLLRDVQKKKLQLERVRQQLERDAQEAFTKMAPLVERHGTLIGELTALFDELLTPGRISARARKEVTKIRRSLELQGVLAPADDEAEDGPLEDDDGFYESWAEANPRANAADPTPEGTHSRRTPHSSAPEVAGAEQVGQGRRSLRELFRSLAKAVHPDQARHDAERERRTEVMKAVTRAYEEGDLARLVELESSWQREQALSENADSLQRCRELERINRELLDQVRQLTRQVRDLKRDARDASMGLTPDELVEQAGEELDELQDVCELVRRFRDGKVALAELVRGPRSRLREDQLSLERLFLDEFSEDFADFAPRPNPARRRRTRR